MAKRTIAVLLLLGLLSAGFPLAAELLPANTAPHAIVAPSHVAVAASLTGVKRTSVHLRTSGAAMVLALAAVPLPTSQQLVDALPASLASGPGGTPVRPRAPPPSFTSRVL